MEYITRLSHFTLSKDGDDLVISSERDSFSTTYDWPDDLTMTDENLESELHERFYIATVNKYNE